MTTQDFKKGIDITGLTNVTASEMIQLIDVARVQDDKGLILVTTDTALDTPDVPNPDVADVQGIVPIWWKRYKWVRLHFNADGKAKEYVWNDKLTVSDATYLKWVYQNKDAEDALNQIGAVDIKATEALEKANNAIINSNNALDKATTAEQEANDAQDDVTNLALQIQQLTTLINSTWPTASYRISALYNIRTAQVYSKEIDQGWLLCDGSAVSRTVFARLFEEIGTRYGAGDGNTTFNIPDCRGYVLAGTNVTGVGGLSARATGDKVGSETHQITTAQLPPHSHTIPNYDGMETVDFATGSAEALKYNAAAATDTGLTGGAEAIPIMQPTMYATIYIKT